MATAAATQNSKPKPTILIVPGSWHPPSAFDTFTPHLISAGYSTQVASLSSVGPGPSSFPSCTDDAHAIRQDFLLPLLESQGKDVLIVAHSYGAIPGSGAAAGLSKNIRQSQGLSGGVIGIVFISGFILREGMSILDVLQRVYPAYIQRSNPSDGLCTVPDPIPTFLADVDPKIAASVAGSFLPHAEHAFDTPAPAPVWAEPGFATRSAYIRCLDDAATPPPVQDLFIQTVGEGISTYDVKGGHNVFLSKPEEIALLVAKLADKYIAS